MSIAIVARRHAARRQWGLLVAVSAARGGNGIACGSDGCGAVAMGLLVAVTAAAQRQWVRAIRFLAKQNDGRICKKAFVVREEIPGFAGRKRVRQQISSCKSVEKANLQERLLANKYYTNIK